MKPIRDRTGEVIGYIHEHGDRRDVRSRTGLIAWYDKRRDMTYKGDGTFAGYGDQAIRFLKEE